MSFYCSRHYTFNACNVMYADSNFVSNQRICEEFISKTDSSVFFSKIMFFLSCYHALCYLAVFFFNLIKITQLQFDCD